MLVAFTGVSLLLPNKLITVLTEPSELKIGALTTLMSGKKSSLKQHKLLCFMSSIRRTPLFL